MYYICTYIGTAPQAWSKSDSISEPMSEPMRRSRPLSAPGKGRYGSSQLKSSHGNDSDVVKRAEVVSDRGIQRADNGKTDSRRDNQQQDSQRVQQANNSTAVSAASTKEKNSIKSPLEGNDNIQEEDLDFPPSFPLTDDAINAIKGRINLKFKGLWCQPI